MGLFGGKKRTTVEKTHTRTTLSKIVKFSYLQTLAIDGGIGSASEVAGETSSSQTEDLTNSTKKDAVNKLAELGGGIGGAAISALFAGDPFIGAISKSLFGKSVSKDTKVDIKESGWNITKTWNQPQFDIIRYAIGIKELSVSRFTYEPVSEFISIPWSSPKEITKVVLTVDQFIPSIFPPGTYIKYYIKPNIQDIDFIQINPLGLTSIFKEDGTIVPRIINFNTEKPLSSRLEDTYFYTDTPVKEVVLKAVFTRPDSLEDSSDVDGYSPVLRSYRILMYPKNGL